MTITITIPARCNPLNALFKIYRHIKEMLKNGESFGRGNNEDYVVNIVF